MTATTIHSAGGVPAAGTTDVATTPVVAVKRRTVDKLLVWSGLVVAVVLAAAGALLLWGSNFSSDYVYDELSSQKIFFPDEAALTEEGRTDLVKYADQQVTTGDEAEAYASYIDGHLQGIADGMTYAELGGPERAAKAAVTEATEAGAPQAQIDELQAKADTLTNQRNTLFKGETLRGLLLSAFAWDTVGQVARVASIIAFVGAAVMLVFVILGVVHLRRLHS